jgi:hypothetical protein
LSAFPVIHGFIVVCKVRGWPGPSKRALEVYSGPAVLLGDDNIVLRITADREINAVAAVVDPNDIVAVALAKLIVELSPRYLDVVVTGAATRTR